MLVQEIFTLGVKWARPSLGAWEERPRSFSIFSQEAVWLGETKSTLAKYRKVLSSPGGGPNRDGNAWWHRFRRQRYPVLTFLDSLGWRLGAQATRTVIRWNGANFVRKDWPARRKTRCPARANIHFKSGLMHPANSCFPPRLNGRQSRPALFAVSANSPVDDRTKCAALRPRQRGLVKMEIRLFRPFRQL